MKLETIERKISEATRAITPVRATYKITDSSVQAELRLSVEYSITYSVDHIHYPKILDRHNLNNPLWADMRVINNEITAVARIIEYREPFVIPANTKTKRGQAIRDRAEIEFRRLHGEEFLDLYRRSTLKCNINQIRKQIEELQAKQMALIPEMRAHNSAYLAERKQAKSRQRDDDQRALASGRFWEASKEALKDYFHPPFDRNYLCDVSAQHRAALYTEMKSTAYKGWNGDWRHKLVGTGRGYLCGIDDNGDEWGHNVEFSWVDNQDQYGDWRYEPYSVQEAMGQLFEIRTNMVDTCYRQGDILFCPVRLRKDVIQVCSRCGAKWEVDPNDGAGYKCNHCHCVAQPVDDYPVELHAHEGPWEIRESHMVESDGLMRNGHYFTSPNPITITHTSHQTVVLEPGEYRLYELQVVDAD